jgi:cobalt-zinc-cadmium efflux system protein
MVATGAHWIDPAAAVLVGLVVAWSALGLLREALARALDATPADIDAGAVQRFLATLPGVADVHDFHVWPLSASRTAMSAHLVMPGGHPGDLFIACAAEELREHHRIDHATLQIEIGDGAVCERAAGCVLKETTP